MYTRYTMKGRKKSSRKMRQELYWRKYELIVLEGNHSQTRGACPVLNFDCKVVVSDCFDKEIQKLPSELFLPPIIEYIHIFYQK